MRVSKQPEINIGMIGHVDHGKTTLTKTLSGEWTDRHSEEIKRGISIKLGYADTTFFKCPKCDAPKSYSVKKICPECGSKTEFLRAVSFVDAPGHETLMATMLSGAAIMNGALLLIAANEKCPQPQTKEHLMALTISGIKNIIIVQNKIDIVDDKKAEENYDQIKNFIKDTIAKDASIVPISAHHEVNIDVLIQEVEKTMPTPVLDEGKTAKLFIARSFDVNTPGNKPKELVGGVIGGTLLQGKLKIGDEIEIAPGRKIEGSGKGVWKNMTSEITSLFAGGKKYKEIRPGGLIGIGTKLDPVYTKSDGFIGKVAGTPGTLPDVLFDFTMKVHLLERVVGASKDLKVEEIKTNEPLMLSVGTTTTVGVVKNARKNVADVILKIPVCADKGQRVAISRRIGGRWRLIGYGIIE